MEESTFYRWLHLLGLLALSYLVLKQVWTLLIGIKNHILSRCWRTNLKKKYGGWAVVTGATDGIGKAYAMELARRGFDVVLISRNVEKLQKVAQEIEKQSGRKTKIIQVDFTGGSEIYPKVEKALKGLDIGILVNNVGMTYHPEANRFLEVPDINKGINNLVNCNVFSMVHMTRIVLPRLVVRKKGLIINISSIAGHRPYPTTTMYGATKAFMDFFSRSLYYEYRSDGITVQSVLPHLVSTNMTFNMDTNILVKTSDDYVQEALNTVGYSHRTNGCLSHCLQSYILDHLLTETVMNSRICVTMASRTLSLLFKMMKVN
ncbi:very-long-chain 3-oxoacyl-CoA reductase-B-like [Bufo gargarizans]|uniref:very-long-chain 3-oxoacyl-CoA reductase-B-like n=1 Tax=Bufo gargarizans TaxID=30331 RepID=UPI001CF29CDA|nr:very-long-chain 3-oxoacyl-CoA reductase-B-like [Bufo gargarizans]